MKRKCRDGKTLFATFTSALIKPDSFSNQRLLHKEVNFPHELITVGITNQKIPITEKRAELINTAFDSLVQRDSRSQHVSSLACYSAIQSESSPRAGLKASAIASQHVILQPPCSFLPWIHRSLNSRCGTRYCSEILHIVHIIMPPPPFFPKIYSSKCLQKKKKSHCLVSCRLIS